MQKRIIAYIIGGIVLALFAYIYIGMSSAKKYTEDANEEEVTPPHYETDQTERLRAAGAMSEGSRQEMVDRLQNAKY